LVGKEAAVNPLSSDGRCRLCRAGHTNLCPNHALIGIHSPGGFAEYVLAPVQNVYPLSDDAGSRTGALAEPLANGVARSSTSPLSLSATAAVPAPSPTRRQRAGFAC